ncbi:HTH-type transcriptional regulator GlvR [Corynebacterium ciconiae DSM 44920]|uniref:MurR/RpiR family transcriptional regulator n=1 Tax=Corynebacterium ciconiae TaxID=227319 RepID=UPI00037F0F43|nr:MurR/RpiR family transcriptional regulator [Corynebacterium ciconiae]WKD61210.1 HTH-type transcriptional regulator GlvR [Corynebacterium ciconiae DSM 44920]
MNLAEHVQRIDLRLSATERDVLAFILAEQEFVADATLSAVAHRAFTSTSSVIRLTQKLGFAGFAELKFFIKNSLAHIPTPSEDLVGVLRSDVEATLDTMDSTDLSEIMAWLAGARTLYCFATGYAQRLATEEFAKSLISSRRYTVVLPTVNEFSASTAVMGPEDMVIIVSLSGATEGLEEILREVTLRGLTVLLIAARSDGYISHYADRTLTYTSTPTMTSIQTGLHHSFVGLNVLLDYLARSLIVFNEQQLESRQP